MSVVEQAEREMRLAHEAGQRVFGARDIDFDKYQMPPGDVAKLRPSSDWEKATIDHFCAPQEQRGARLPWSKTHGLVRIRPGELSIWAGVNGHGKSMILSQVMLSLMTQGETACIASLEMKPVATLARMARQCVGVEEPAPTAIRRFHDLVAGSLWLYDQQGTVQMQRMLAVVRYAREELKVQHVVIDSLMKCGIDSDDYNAQKRFIDALATYARDSDVHVHLVAHARKRDNESHAMDKMDIKGAGDITDLADNVFLLWRNRPKEDKVESGKAKDDEKSAADAVLHVSKQRHGEWEGKVALWFNRKAMQYVGRNTTQAIDYLALGKDDDEAAA